MAVTLADPSSASREAEDLEGIDWIRGGGKPPLSILCRASRGGWEVWWQIIRWRDAGEQFAGHHIRDAAKVQAWVIAGDPRVRDLQQTGLLNHRNHFRRHFAVVHILPFHERMRPNCG